MKILLISDIHSNLEAFQSVLSAVSGEKVDETWILGDVTGYGPDPKACLDLVKGLQNRKVIKGNHDRVVSKQAPPLGFNSHAIAAVYKNMGKLTPEEQDWLAQLPDEIMGTQDFGLYHGSPVDPDEYLLSPDSSGDSFSVLQSKGIRVGLFGHTHLPTFYEFQEEKEIVFDLETGPNKSAEIPIKGPGFFLINPGSVGQPRDGNPDAAFGILEIGDDKAVFTFRRAPYDVRATQVKMTAENFPDILIKRLSVGY